MRAVLLLGRQCLRPHLRAGQPTAARSAFARASRPQSIRSAFSSRSPGRAYTSLPSLRAPPRSRFGGSVLLFAATTALSPAAFVALSQQSNDDDDRTGEQLMLEASRAELKNQVPKVIQHSKTFRKGLYFFFENYIWEPLATGLRFAHLVVIFVPVILTVPVIWIGRRVPDRDNERSGTLWWYAFLVRSMERAGAAFIKVGLGNSIDHANYGVLIPLLLSSANGQRRGQTYSLPKCASTCRLSTPTRRHIPCMIPNGL